MNIDYVEIRSAENRELIAIIDTANSVIWQTVYFGVGEFEIYCRATKETVDCLKRGNYVTRPDDDECGIIENIVITTDENGFKMITASGRFVKSLLDRRVIFTATIDGSGNEYVWRVPPITLSGKVEEAARKLVTDNIINPVMTARAADIIELDALAGYPDVIVVKDSEGETDADKQTELQNLLTYTDALLQEYNMSAAMRLDYDTLKFKYKVFKGKDFSIDNTDGNEPIVFSKDYDNLLTNEYDESEDGQKNTAIIGGEGEGLERYFAFSNAGNAGLARRETFIDAKGISRTYKDENDIEKTYTLGVYRKMLEAQGSQTLSTMKPNITFSGKVDLVSTHLTYRADFNIGDIVTIQDNELGIYTNARILTVLEVQDEDGYSIELGFGY